MPEADLSASPPRDPADYTVENFAPRIVDPEQREQFVRSIAAVDMRVAEMTREEKTRKASLQPYLDLLAPNGDPDALQMQAARTLQAHAAMLVKRSTAGEPCTTCRWQRINRHFPTIGFDSRNMCMHPVVLRSDYDVATGKTTKKTRSTCPSMRTEGANGLCGPKGLLHEPKQSWPSRLVARLRSRLDA